MILSEGTVFKYYGKRHKVVEYHGNGSLDGEDNEIGEQFTIHIK